MKLTMGTIALAAVLAWLNPALADWAVTDPFKMHYPQLPDLQSGLNVRATVPKVLADDFLCIQSGPITDIHVWGSWLNDVLPVGASGQPDFGAVNFHLSIHADIPAGSAVPYSRPGDLLWEADFPAGSFRARDWAWGNEGFFDPNVNQIIGFDTRVIQYNFFIPAADAFVQEKDTIYWLDVMAQPVTTVPNILFGWKTSADHWNDDAVWADWVPGAPIAWHELIDPRNGESLDLAFVITPEPGSLSVVVLGGLGVLLRRRRR